MLDDFLHVPTALPPGCLVTPLNQTGDVPLVLFQVLGCPAPTQLLGLQVLLTLPVKPPVVVPLVMPPKPHQKLIVQQCLLILICVQITHIQLLFFICHLIKLLFLLLLEIYDLLPQILSVVIVNPLLLLPPRLLPLTQSIKRLTNCLRI